MFGVLFGVSLLKKNFSIWYNKSIVQFWFHLILFHNNNALWCSFKLMPQGIISCITIHITGVPLSVLLLLAPICFTLHMSPPSCVTYNPFLTGVPFSVLCCWFHLVLAHLQPFIIFVCLLMCHRLLLLLLLLLLSMLPILVWPSVFFLVYSTWYYLLITIQLIGMPFNVPLLIDPMC